MTDELLKLTIDFTKQFKYLCHSLDVGTVELIIDCYVFTDDCKAFKARSKRTIEITKDKRIILKDDETLVYYKDWEHDDYVETERQ